MTVSFNEDAAIRAFELTKRTGGRRLFVLVEMDGLQRDRYLKTVQKKVDMKSDGTATVKEIEGMQGGILALMAKEVTSIDHYSELPTAESLQAKLDSGELTIEHLALRDCSMEEVQSWPSKTQSTLSTMAQELSGLTKDAREKEKKD